MCSLMATMHDPEVDNIVAVGAVLQPIRHTHLASSRMELSKSVISPVDTILPVA
jgi:hypothetical protein